MEASRAATEPRARRQLALLGRPTDRGFEQLYRKHAREVYQYALALTSNRADAEDVTQTTFLNAYRAVERGERPQKPHNWLIAIAHNVCRMRWRQAGSRPREVPLEEAPEPASRDEEQPDLDEVLTALAALSFNQRAAIVMRELEGRSYQEIAGVLGLSVSAVEALLFRARRNLQVRRRALGVLTTVPLPGSLASFIGGGGGAVVAGSAAVGAQLVLKVAVVVAVGAATVGAGYKGVQAMTAPPAAPRTAAVVPEHVSRARPQTAAAQRPHRGAVAVRRPALKRTVAAPSSSPVSRPTADPSGSLPASAPEAAPPPPPPVAPPPAAATAAEASAAAGRASAGATTAGHRADSAAAATAAAANCRRSSNPSARTVRAM